MRIVVLGGGTVGTSIAGLLCRHRHSVTVVDADSERVRRINDTLDVRAITGSASQSSVLFQAGVIDCDLCLAVTGIDEVNLVAGSMAKAMKARRSVARVYAPVFRDLSTFDYQRHFNIDRLLSLEHLVAMDLARAIRHPGSVTVESLARGLLEVQEVEIGPKTSALGRALKQFDLPAGLRVGSIARNGRVWIPGADDSFEVDDRITLIGTRDTIDQVKDTFRGAATARMGVVIAGGGETGYHLARALEGLRFSVLMMDYDRERCDFLAANLKHSTVVHSDACRRVNLEEERVGSADVFVACMGDDENNIMAGVEARELGAKSILAIVKRPDYANVVEKVGIDHAVSPREVVAKQVLGYLHTGPVISRTPLGGGGISVLEIEVHEGAAATEHVLANLDLPEACLIVAVMRDEFARVPGADDRLAAGDTVVAMVEDGSIDKTVGIFRVPGA